MAEITVTLKGKEIKKYPVSTAITRIGRGQVNDISLPNKSVSREHATITHKHQNYWLKSLNASNGVWVNGQLCQELVPLSNGDRIQVGKYILSLSIQEDTVDFDSFQKTEALSINDLQKFADNYSATPSKSHDEVRFERTKYLEKQVKLYQVVLVLSLIGNLCACYSFL
jgi:pSer/pThr/pTyr-binding forkhead associated (FHA) protein